MLERCLLGIKEVVKCSCTYMKEEILVGTKLRFKKNKPTFLYNFFHFFLFTTFLLLFLSYLCFTFALIDIQFRV
jgi:hypothetical protein